jgi:hypothetical protein
MIESFLRAIDASDFDNRLRQLEDPLKPVRLLPVRLLNVGRPAEKRDPTWDMSSSHTPDTAEDSKPTAESPLFTALGRDTPTQDFRGGAKPIALFFAAKNSKNS